MSTRQRWSFAFGLGLLYSSAFFLPLVDSYYQQRPMQEVVFPSLVSVVVVTAFSLWFLSIYQLGKRWRWFSLIVMSSLCWMTILGAFAVTGYSALGVALLVSDSPSIETTRWVRVMLVVAGVFCLIVAVNSVRRYWLNLVRMMALLGYLFGGLGILRGVHFQHPSDAQYSLPASAAASLVHSAVPAVPAPRQVVWIIMDELDYEKTIGAAGGPTNPRMPNLEHLATEGISAKNAFSPAKDTVASLPALLTGYTLTGLEFENRTMLLKTQNHGIRPFQESDSVFGRLPQGPSSSAILGFYHPYCTLFASVAPCFSMPYANVGRWFDALFFFGQQAIATARYLPHSSELLSGRLFYELEPMYRITDETLRRFPKFAAIDDKALVFIHVNLPHPPGDYAQRALHLLSAGDDRESYRRNLQLVDQLIGEAMSAVQARAERQEILLIVSSDHWHRIESPLTARRIPWIAWRVGKTKGVELDDRLNTVHTADLVLAFLQGNVDSQEDISAWWQKQNFSPTLMPHGYLY